LLEYAVDARDVEVNQRTELAVSGVLGEEDLHPIAIHRREDGQVRLELMCSTFLESQGTVERLACQIRLDPDCRDDGLHHGFADCA
jgi:hypothetical protein